MVDEIFDRAYRDGRADLNSALGSLLKSIGETINDSFRALNRIEYSAPWAARPRRSH